MAKLPVEKLKVSKGKPSAPVPVKIVDVPTNSTSSNKDYEARERKYRAEDALRDIERAEKHKSDKGLMKDVKACAAEKIKAYKGL
jgi:hypothetical protein